MGSALALLLERASARAFPLAPRLCRLVARGTRDRRWTFTSRGALLPQHSSLLALTFQARIAQLVDLSAKCHLPWISTWQTS